MRQSANLVAGVIKPYNVAGDFFYLETLPAGQLSVRFFRGNSPLGEELECAERGWHAAPDGGFDRLELTSTLTQVVVFHIVSGRVGVNVFSGAVTITSGTLTAITDPVSLNPEDARYFLFGDDETADGEAFWSTSTAGPVAAQVSVVQLFNPAASGKILYVDHVSSADATANDRMELRENAAAIVGLINNGFNKNGGGAVSVAQLRAGATAAPGGTVVQNRYHLANVTTDFPLRAPVRLPEGRGLMLVSFSVNQLIVGNFHWREKAA